MTKRAFIEWLNEVEARFPVASWTVDGIRVWPMIRLNLFAWNYQAMVASESLGGGWRSRALSVGRGLTAWARASVTDRAASVPPTSPADAVFLTAGYGEQPVVAGRKYNTLLAPYVELLQQLHKRSTVWEMCPYGDYNTPRYTPSHYIQPRLMYLRAGSQLSSRGGRVRPAVLDRFDEFVAAVHRRELAFGYAGGEAMRRDVFFVRTLETMYSRWLERVQPTLVFTIDHWLREHALCLACRRFASTSVEIQHGVQGDTHPSYGSWAAVPVGGYETRTDVFWCWDRESADAINRWSRTVDGGPVAIVGGDPWRELWHAGQSPVVAEIDAEITARKQQTGAHTHVLVGLDSTGPVIPGVLLDAMRTSPRDWCYWLRAHPVDARRRIPEAARVLNEAGVVHEDVGYVTRLPLHALLRQVNAHVTVSWSSIVPQAADFGIPSVACAERAAEVHATVFAEGMLTIASTALDLMQQIDFQSRRRIPVPQTARPQPVAAMQQVLAMRAPLRRGVQTG